MAGCSTVTSAGIALIVNVMTGFAPPVVAKLSVTLTDVSGSPMFSPVGTVCR